MINRVALGMLFAVSFAQPAWADSETEALRAQIKALEARLEQLEKKQAIAEASGEETKKSTLADNTIQKIQSDKRPANVEFDLKGLSISSPDNQYNVRMRAFAQTQYRYYSNNTNPNNTNEFVLRTARPFIDAKLTDYFNARIVADIGNSQTRMVEAYLDFKPIPESPLFVLRGGKFKLPLGLERWQSEQELSFAERSQTTNLVPSRDQGLMIFGEMIPEQLEYHLAITNGAEDLAENASNPDNHKDISGRLFAHPFHASEIHSLKGLGVGIAGSYGKHLGNTTSTGLVSGYNTFGQARYFTYSSGSYSDGLKWRVNPQLYYYNGSFGLLAEYMMNSQEISNGSSRDTIKNDAWLLAANYVLTGEKVGFDGVDPDHNFNLLLNQWGAFEIAARASVLNIDDGAFPIFSNISASARKATEGVIGINWYLNHSLKLNFDYAITSFEGGAASGADREDEHTLITQAQFRF